MIDPYCPKCQECGDGCGGHEPCMTMPMDVEYIEVVSGPVAYEVRPETISTADYHQGQ
jgi:hypothetical protein